MTMILQNNISADVHFKTTKYQTLVRDRKIQEVNTNAKPRPDEQKSHQAQMGRMSLRVKAKSNTARIPERKCGRRMR
jgi:hypothetical protein